MAKQRAVVIEDDAEAVELTRQEEEFEQANEDTDGELLRSLQEMRGTAGVTLLFTRTYPNTPDMLGYVGEMTPAEFTLDHAREVYGPGKYRIRVKGPKGFLPGGGTINIAKGPATVRATEGGNLDAITKLIQSMEEQRRAQAAEATARRDKWIELAIPGLLTIIAGLLGKNNGPDLTALVAAMKPAPGPSLTDLTTSLASLKNLTAVPADDSKLETLMKVMEFAKSMSGEGGDKGESNWIDVVRDLLKEGPALVQPLLENLRAQQGAPPASLPLPMTVQPRVTAAVMPGPPGTPLNVPTGSPSSPLPQSASVPPSTDSATGEPDMNLYLPLIRAQLAKLLQWAQEKRRVELYAEVLLEELPAIVHQFVTPEKALEYLNHPQWFEIITSPPLGAVLLANHREWLDAMRREVIDIIKEQLREEPRFEPADSTLVDDTASTGTAE